MSGMERGRKWASFGENSLLQWFGSSPLNNYRILIKQQSIFKEEYVTTLEESKSLQLCWALAPLYQTQFSSRVPLGEQEENKQTCTETTQTAAEPEEKPVAAAPVQKKKYKIKSVQLARDEEEVEPSQQQEEEGPKIITQSLSLGCEICRKISAASQINPW